MTHGTIRWICIFSLFVLCTDGKRKFHYSHRNEFFDAQDAPKPVLEFDKEAMTLALNTEGTFRMRASENLSTAVNITFHLTVAKGDEGIVQFHKSSYVLPAGLNATAWVEVKLKGVIVGHDCIVEANCTNVNGSGECELGTEDAMLRVAVVHSIPLLTLISIVGWIYFAAWSISFYPQILLNWRRKSVLGLNFDFLALNATGFLFYSLYNCAMFWIPVVQEEYERKYPKGMNPVQVNDVVFALHAFVATLVTVVQCFIYEKGHQRVSKVCRGLLTVMWLTAIVSVIVAGSKATTWLIFFDILSGIKLAITLVKYIPQAYYNYRRKSTAGWSIGNILLDFTGGFMSLVQMFLLAYNNDDWREIFGDFTKFGLGAISLSFDILFMAQHYIFYRHAVAYEPQDSVMDDEDDDDEIIGGPQHGSNSIHVPYVDADER